MAKPLILGTRNSALALTQVELACAALRAAHPGIALEVREIVTSGDRGAPAESDKAGLKGLFTKEIEQALLRGEIDVAVHSGKDLPGHMVPELTLGAALERAPVADWLISKKPLSEISTVGTSSVRRQHQLAWAHPGWRLVEWRGNVPTRLAKLHSAAEVDAIVLAEAGLRRLRLDPADSGFQVFPLDTLPAAGQGVITLQTRVNALETLEHLRAVNHGVTFACLSAERALLRRLDGDCKTPIAALAEKFGAEMRLRALLFIEGKVEPIAAEAEGGWGESEQMAGAVYQQLMKR